MWFNKKLFLIVPNFDVRVISLSNKYEVESGALKQMQH